MNEENAEREARFRNVVAAGMATLSEEDRLQILVDAMRPAVDSWKARERTEQLIGDAINKQITDVLKTPEMQEMIRHRAELLARDLVSAARVTTDRR